MANTLGLCVGRKADACELVVSLRVCLVAQTQQQFTIVDLDITRLGVLFAVVRPAPGRQAALARRPSSALCLH